MRLQLQAIMLATVTLGFGQSRQSDANGNVGISHRVAVDVYLSDRDDSSILMGPAATAVASGIFKGIGVRLKWHRGEVRAARSSHRDGAIPPAFGVCTVERAPDAASASALASAELLASSGAEITVYKERFLRFLADHPSFKDAAAGYVLAHELAHMMQGVPRHSESGVLKAQWSTDDFKQMVLHKLAFTTLDVELIHRGLVLRLPTDTAILFATTPPASGTQIITASGGGAASAVGTLQVRVAGRSYSVAAAYVPRSTPLEDRLLPASTFRAVYVSNSERYIVFEPSTPTARPAPATETRPTIILRVVNAAAAEPQPLALAKKEAERDPQNHTFTTRDYVVHMEVRFHEPYLGKRLVLYNSANPNKEICVVPSGTSVVCPNRFVGAVATVTFAIKRASGKPVNRATIREVVTVLSQSPELSLRPPLEKTMPATRGVMSDLQVFGYDETEIPEEQRAGERKEWLQFWRIYRQELYLNDDRDPFAVIHWRHTLNRIEIVDVQQR